MITFPISAKELGQFEKKLKDQTKAWVARALDQASRDSVALLKRVSESRVLPFRGKYSQGWRVETPAWNTARVYNEARSDTGFPYPVVIEKGRKPGAKMPPPDALVPWVMHRLAVSSQQAVVISWAVARLIAIRGIRGKFVLRDTWPDVQKILQKALDQGLSEAIRRSL